MASRVLYPAVIDSYMPAFQVKDVGGKKKGTCIVNFSLSKFNVDSNFESIQVAVMKQGSGVTAINPVDSNSRYRSNGKIIIINTKPSKDETTGLYSFELTQDDIRNGQNVGSLYKIQIRLSSIKYNEISNQSDQLNKNASSFSEWSTVCIIKAIGSISLVMNEPFNADLNSSSSSEVATTLYQSTIGVGGCIISEDSSEKMYSYKLDIYKKNTEEDLELIETSGELLANKYQNSNDFFYAFKTEFEDGLNCKLILTYTTINGFVGSQFQDFIISQAQDTAPKVKIVTADAINIKDHHSEQLKINSPNQNKNDVVESSDSEVAEEYNYGLKSVMSENEEGRIGLKLQPTSSTQEEEAISKNLCIRRCDEKDNFTHWTDIKIIPVINQKVSEIEVFYDYTIESGVYYKYGVQEISKNGKIRSLMETMSTPVCREFEYSFLLGPNNKQLKLKYNNDMNNYKIQQLESKVETIGGKYPIITRNAAVEYKIFPINGLISFSLDDNNLFYSREEAYGEEEDWKNIHFDTSQYNRTQERDFRNKVLEQLHDGTPKLFKSPTEGNIIVRLTDISCTPAQNLGRLIYSFSSTGNEFAEASMENYLKYNFYEVGTQINSFATTEIKIGQISKNFEPGMDLIDEIFKKYDSRNEQIAGKVRKLESIYAIKITFNDKPMRLPVVGTENLGEDGIEYYIGNKINIIGTKINTIPIMVFGDYYVLDENLKFTDRSSQHITFDIDEKATSSINVNVDFLYTISIDDYNNKIIKSQTVTRGIGQLFTTAKANTSLFNIIYYKYYIEIDNKFKRLSRLTGVELEGDPGVIFGIRDSSTEKLEYHEINKTGILNLHNINDIVALTYVGKRKEDGSIDTSRIETVKVTYSYILLEGEYEQDE